MTITSLKKPVERAVHEVRGGEILVTTVSLNMTELPRSVLIQLLRTDGAPVKADVARRTGFSIISRSDGVNENGDFELRGIVPVNIVEGRYEAVGISYVFHDGRVRMESVDRSSDEHLTVNILAATSS